ncbi:hypothetical protein OEZ86_009889 [Tetradesmus obliquus]|nr:hypothetical protein OEZ86_009889 [Tetradesmus obliquus]
MVWEGSQGAASLSESCCTGAKEDGLGGSAQGLIKSPTGTSLWHIMFPEHEAGKKRKLEAVSSDPVAETDEQLARRLHEELNALTRHSRRGPAPAPVLSTQRSSSGKVAKLPAAGGSKAAAPKAKQQLQEQQLQGSNEEQAEDAQEESAAAKSDKPRKRSTNRELAMLEVDMVETHVKPVAGLRSKSKDEHDQHDQQQQLQQQQDDHHSAAAKHESSSSLSEQERLAIEHLHAAGVEGKPVNKLLEAAHLAARYGKKWYRAKVLKDAGSKVMLEYQGFSHEGGPFWLARDHARIWRGSYKGKDWRYLGDGAWEPKQQMVGGSDLEDVEAACVLVGASMGRAHSGELYGMYDSMQQQHSGSFGQRCSAGADDSQLSPRGYGHARQGGRRRGHNWSKPLNRPPRPPPAQQQQQGGNGHMLARRHSLTNGNSLQQQQQYQQQGLYGAAAAEQGLQHAHSTSQDLPPFGGAASPRMGRQSSVPEAALLRNGAQQQQQVRNGSCLLFGSGDSEGKAATLRALLDAVGEVQATSNRPDLMYPMQYGGLPMGAGTPAAEPPRPCAAALHVPHVHMSAATAALLAAVPSLEALQSMAALQGQAGLLACLNGSAPSLFQ